MSIAAAQFLSFDKIKNFPKIFTFFIVFRPYSMIGANATEATQSNELPGYEPAKKERRLSKKLILRDCTPKANAIWTPTSKQNVQDGYVSDDQGEENTSLGQLSSLEKSRIETSQYPIFTETILENTQFQNVLVENINRILENSSERIDLSAESGSQLSESVCNNNSLQEQVKYALDNIILSTERDPTFQQVLDDVVQHTAIQEQTSPHGISDIENNSDEKSDSSVPLKQRLRNRSQDKPQPNYNELDPNSKKKRKTKVEVISNEIVSGGIRDLLNPTTTVRTDNYVPMNQILYVNSDRTTATTFGQDLVYVNLGSSTFPQFRIDADTPMFLHDISVPNNNGASTSLAPGSIINIPTVEQQIQPIQSMLPNVIIKDIFEVTKTKQIQRSGKATPSAVKNQTKSRLTTPRRQSHVRSLNFATSEDLSNENERLTDKRNSDANKLEPVVNSSPTKSLSMRKSENETDHTNEKTSLEEVEQQQDSSDAVDFSKEFDEATVISVELSPLEPTQPSKDEKNNVGSVSEKKKPQTRRQSQKDMEMWRQMRQMNKKEWDNYLRQTNATKNGNAPTKKEKLKRRKAKVPAKSDEANVSINSGNNSTTELEARLLEEALQSAKKPVSPVNKNHLASENSKVDSSKEVNVVEQTKSNSSSVAQGVDIKNPRSPIKRTSTRKQLIQIKLPSSAKKKFTKSKKRRVKSVVKRVINPPVKPTAKPHSQPAAMTRIDPEQSVDIDLISPIEHPQELNYPMKSNVNLNAFLETPLKDSMSFKFPITPGFAISSSSKTPGVRLLKEYDSSLIKFPEYPTPSFAITPGRTKTPVSQSSSQKDGSCYNRATDYSSGSSYYKPDESDDIDKNLDVLIKESRTHTNIGGLGVDPQQNIIMCNDQQVSDAELSDSSSSSSSSSNTSSSSSSTCSSSPTVSTATDSRNKAQSAIEIIDVKKSLAAQRSQHLLKLEQVRLRTMATLKSDKKIERFRKPKPKISTLQRHKIIDNSHMKKTAPTLKMSGNSTPKVTLKPLPKHMTKPAIKPNQKPTTTTPSKRKIATPRRVIYLGYNEPVKTTTRTVSHERKQSQSEPLLSQSNENAKSEVLKTVQESSEVRPATPMETIDAIENHIAKTSRNSFEEPVIKSTPESQIDTINLLLQLQGQSDSDKVTTPVMGPPATSNKRATLVRELFGDGTMSDSDFMDTPVKVSYSSRTSISHATPEISVDSVSKDSVEQGSVIKESTDKASLKVSIAKELIPKVFINSVVKDSIPTATASIAKDSVSKDSVSKDAIAIDYITKDSITKDSANQCIAKDSTVELPTTKHSIAKVSTAKDSIVKQSIVKDSTAKDSSAKDSSAKDSTTKNFTAKDSTAKDSLAKETTAKDTLAKDSITKDSSTEDFVDEELLNKEPEASTSPATVVTLNQCVTDSIESIDADSNSDSDCEDDYEKCTMISALQTGKCNKTYHEVFSDTKEGEIERVEVEPYRPQMTTHWDGRQIVVNTHDEFVIYGVDPKNAPPMTSTGSKRLINKRKTLKTVQGVKSKVDVEQDQKIEKMSCDGTDSVNATDVAIAPEKNFRFKVIAKHKGPVDVSSSQSSSR